MRRTTGSLDSAPCLVRVPRLLRSSIHCCMRYNVVHASSFQDFVLLVNTVLETFPVEHALEWNRWSILCRHGPRCHVCASHWQVSATYLWCGVVGAFFFLFYKRWAGVSLAVRPPTCRGSCLGERERGPGFLSGQSLRIVSFQL